MSIGMAIETVYAVTNEELGQLAAEFGGVPQALGNEQIGYYYIHTGAGHLHVSLSPEILYILSNESTYLSRVVEKLGEMPHAAINVAILNGGEKDAAQFSLKFCIAAARRWHSIVDNLMPDDDLELYSLEEMEAIEGSGGVWFF